jgi:hypothetical protein
MSHLASTDNLTHADRPSTAGLWWASKYRSTDGKIIFYPLHFSAEVFGLAVLAPTGRLHSAAVRDIVLL